MKRLTVFTATLLLSAMANAALPTDNAAVEQLTVGPLAYLKAFDAAPTIPQACTDANFTADQQSAIHNEVYATERKMVLLKSDLQLAVMDYGHTIKDTTKGLADAQTAQGTVTTAIGALASAKIDLLNTLLYNVLTPQQRDPAISCFMQLEKMAMEKKLGKICAQLPKP